MEIIKTVGKATAFGSLFALGSALSVIAAPIIGLGCVYAGLSQKKQQDSGTLILFGAGLIAFGPIVGPCAVFYGLDQWLYDGKIIESFKCTDSSNQVNQDLGLNQTQGVTVERQPKSLPNLDLTTVSGNSQANQVSGNSQANRINLDSPPPSYQSL